MRTSTAVLALSTWTLAGCSQEFESSEKLLDPPTSTTTADNSASSSSTMTQHTNGEVTSLTALEAAWNPQQMELMVRYHAEDSLVVAVCGQTQDGEETCVSEKTDVSQTISITDMIANGTYSVTVIDDQGEQFDYGPYKAPTQQTWQDVIACTSEVHPARLKVEERGDRLYIESAEEWRVIVCDGKDCDESRGFDGIEVAYTAGVSKVTVQDQYGCKATIFQPSKM